MRQGDTERDNRLTTDTVRPWVRETEIQVDRNTGGDGKKADRQ